MFGTKYIPDSIIWTPDKHKTYIFLVGKMCCSVKLFTTVWSGNLSYLHSVTELQQSGCQVATDHYVIKSLLVGQKNIHFALLHRLM